MSKAGKILLNILSWAPLAWTILIIIAALCYNFKVDSFNYHSFSHALKEFIYLTMIFYVLRGGFFIWLALIILLAWKKIITKRQCIINIFLTAAGILLAYLSLRYNIFGVMDSYLD